MQRECEYKYWLDACDIIGEVQEIDFRFGKVVVMWKANDGFRTCTYSTASEGKLMQYTGYKDMNNMQIFDADIVRTTVNGKKWKVGYKRCSWIFEGISTDEWYYFHQYILLLEKAGAKIERIGNVYTHPELLKK